MPYSSRSSSRQCTGGPQPAPTKQYHTMNVLDVPRYDNGYGIPPPPQHRKTIYIDSGPTLPYLPKRSTSINSTPQQSAQSTQRAPRSDRQMSKTTHHVPHVRQPYARPKSQRVSYLHVDDDLIPSPLRVKKSKMPSRAWSKLQGPAPGMHKYMNKSLPPLPLPHSSKHKQAAANNSSARHIRRIESRSQLLARYADDVSLSSSFTIGAAARAKLPPSSQHLHTTRSRLQGGGGKNLVNHHLHEGKVSKFNPNIYSSADRREIADAALALSRHRGEGSMQLRSKGKVSGRKKTRTGFSLCNVM